jgi:hypothetical protein
MMLGTEAQLSGNLAGAVSEAEIPFISRYAVDEGVVSTLSSHEKAGGIGTHIRANARKANQLMEQAQEASRNGDIATASRLRAQAENTLADPGGRHAGWYPVLGAEDIRSAFVLNQNPEVEGATRLSSPMAKTAGQLVKQGREFLDPESETSRGYRQSLTEGAQRSIAAESRSAQRQARDFGLMRGSARSPGQAAHVGAAIKRDFAQQRAQVETQAAQQYEAFSRQFAADSVSFGQAFLQNQSFVREPFQAARDNLLTSGAELANRTADRSLKFSGESAERHAKSKARTMSIVTSVVGAVVGIATMGVGLAVGGAAGTALISAGGGITSNATKAA